MLPVIALLAVGTGYANKNDVNNNADNNIKVAEQYNNEESLDVTNRILYESCINLNIGAACSSLGYSYGTGEGVKQDYSKANFYFEKACNMNDGEGCHNLGYSYDSGIGVKQMFTMKKHAT